MPDAREAQDAALKDFKALLQAELAAQEVLVEPLQECYWARNPYTRAIFLAHEMDKEMGTSHAKQLHLASAKTLGDSRSCENVHQHHRDLQKPSKNDTFSDTQAFANAWKSPVLEERNVEMVTVENASKVMEHGRRVEAITYKLRSRHFKCLTVCRG